MDIEQVNIELDYFHIPIPIFKQKMMYNLIQTNLRDKANELFTLSKEEVLNNLLEASKQGHSEVGINLIPMAATISDSRYESLKGKKMGCVWAPNPTIINILGDIISIQFIELFKYIFKNEGFDVTVGERSNYFLLPNDDNNSLFYLVVSWKKANSSTQEITIETLSRILFFVEDVSMSMKEMIKKK